MGLGGLLVQIASGMAVTLVGRAAVGPSARGFVHSCLWAQPGAWEAANRSAFRPHDSLWHFDYGCAYALSLVARNRIHRRLRLGHVQPTIIVITVLLRQAFLPRYAPASGDVPSSRTGNGGAALRFKKQDRFFSGTCFGSFRLLADRLCRCSRPVSLHVPLRSQQSLFFDSIKSATVQIAVEIGEGHSTAIRAHRQFVVVTGMIGRHWSLAMDHGASRILYRVGGAAGTRSRTGKGRHKRLTRAKLPEQLKGWRWGLGEYAPHGSTTTESLIVFIS